MKLLIFTQSLGSSADSVAVPSLFTTTLMHSGWASGRLLACTGPDFSLAQLWTGFLSVLTCLDASEGKQKSTCPGYPLVADMSTAVSVPSGASTWNVVEKSEQAGSSQQGQPQPRHLETPCSGHCLVPPEVPAEAAPEECQLLEPAASYPLHQPHTHSDPGPVGCFHSLKKRP